MAEEGWIKLYRSIRSNWLWENGNERYAKWWMDILLMVNHKPRKMMDKTNHLVMIETGMTLTSERKLSAKWEVNRRTVHNFLNLLEEEKMISLKRMQNKYTTLKVNNYGNYQSFSSESEPRNTPRNAPHNTPRNAHEQELKELKNKDSELDFKEFFDYLNKVTGRSFRNIQSNQKLVSARLKAGYTKMDLKLVIDYKTSEWKGTDYEKYLQPSTLFKASKFDEYLNQAKLAISKQRTKTTSDGQRASKTAEEIEAERKKHAEEITRRAEERLNNEHGD